MIGDQLQTNIIKKQAKNLQNTKLGSTFAPQMSGFGKQTRFRRDGRVVDCGGLENR